MLPDATRLLGNAEFAAAEADPAVRGRVGTYAGNPAAHDFAVRKFYPGIELQIRDMSSASQLAALLGGRLDAVVTVRSLSSVSVKPAFALYLPK